MISFISCVYLSSSCRLIVLSIQYFGMELRTAAEAASAQNMFVHVAVMSFEPIPQIPLELFFYFCLFLFVVLFLIIFIHMPLLGKHLSSIFRFGFPGFFVFSLWILTVCLQYGKCSMFYDSKRGYW